MTQLISWGLLAFGLSFVMTVFVKQLALKKGAVDVPTKARKIHKKPIARLGGLAIFVAFSAVMFIILASNGTLVSGSITYFHYAGVFIGGLILMFGGYVDDRYELPAHISIVSPFLAAITVIIFGIEIEKLSNPFGGVIYLTEIQSDILVFVWLMVVMYTTKFLDGLDGLATSVTSIGSLMIMLLSLTVAYYQPDVALMSAVAIGSMLGFLFWNFHPASIFLGEGGSTYVGFLLGVLAVISGGKLATALLVLGIPLLDAVWVVVRRYRAGGIKNIFAGDRKHLHHRLYDRGFGQRSVVLFYMIIATSFGITTLVFQSREKLVALVILALLMLLVALFFSRKDKYEAQ
ncbi:undecaprenyl/decaprenyl-phosphate alpha-N-acetylglucosaminyl 1-phosphate transferase [Candidatus Uhrbacteria bacterium]|jgi:UDP-GlcNAc:undecaprenyl-phosphate/decaprenyl-phosphate GlcNAc-1-phosphate transferase|nr:undecaprenyl/decaprenyl-phosphate alpha-N-acetylglucosaminyl 1-phosphate transferase [Candidatus Uhrbacteria bacterium]